MSKQYELRDRLLADFFRAKGATVGAKLPALEELCRTYQVSSPTMRQVLKGLVGKGWLETQWGKGSFIKRVEPPVSDRVGAEHLTIGYVAGNMRMPLGMDFLEGLEAAAHRLEVGVMVANSNFSVAKEREHVHHLRSRGVAGVVVYPTDRCEEHDWLGEELRDFNMVVVDLYRQAMNRSHVVFDNRTAGREITEGLLEQGRRRIAFVKFSHRHPFASVDERYQGYLQALNYAGITQCPDFATVEHPTSPSEDSHIYTELDRLLDLAQPPDAIIFPMDLTVVMGINYLRKRGVVIPKNLMFAGFDNLQGPRPDPWLTTRPDFRRLGERAAELLVEMIRDGSNARVEAILPCPVWMPPVMTHAGVTAAHAKEVESPLAEEVVESGVESLEALVR